MTASSKTLTLTSEMNLNAIDPGHLVFGLDPGGVHEVEIGVRPALVALKSRLLSVRASARAEFLDEAPFPVREGLRVGVIPLGAADGSTRSAPARRSSGAGASPGSGAIPPSTRGLTSRTRPTPGVGDEVVIIGGRGRRPSRSRMCSAIKAAWRASDVTRRILASLPRLYVG